MTNMTTPPRALPPQTWCKILHPETEVTDGFLDEVSVAVISGLADGMQVNAGRRG